MVHPSNMKIVHFKMNYTKKTHVPVYTGDRHSFE